MQKKIPIACDIVCGKEIIYQCPKCKQFFNILGHTELYCHHCGQALDWSHVLERLPTSCPSDMAHKSKILKEINNIQLENSKIKGENNEQRNDINIKSHWKQRL